jgi:hypothetical protein
MNKVGANTTAYFFSFIMMVSMFSYVIPEIWFVKYLTIPLFFIFLFSENKGIAIVANENLKAWLLLIAVGLITSIFHVEFFLDGGFKDLIIISSYVMIFLLIKDYEFRVVLLFQFLVFSTLLLFLFMDKNEFSILDSTAVYESPISFVFGAFFIYFLVNKKWLYVSISLFFVILTLKRVALLAMLVVTIVHILPIYYKHYVLKSRMFVLYSLLSFFLIMLFSSGLLDVFIDDYFGISSNSFSMGRFVIYQNVFNEIINNPQILILGAGAGAGYSNLNYFVEYDFQYSNLHSDILKISYEYGAIFLIIFIYKLSSFKSNDSRLFVLYLLIIFISDNIFVYSNIMFFILLLAYKLEYDYTERVMYCNGGHKID